MLNTIISGHKSDQPALLIAHGLHGSARNWGVIAKRLASDRQTIAVDMRNHGKSDWFPTHNYSDMAGDLAEVIRHVGAPMDVLGHSMGGKAAMALALMFPELVRRLIVADISPVAYGHSHLQLTQVMGALDLSQVATRGDADRLLSGDIDNPAVRAFLLQSLDIKEKRWRLNLDVLGAEMEKIVGFPRFETSFSGPTFFVAGRDSDYIRTEHRPETKRLFPSARFAKIPGAGHWLHADKPREFEAAVSAFLGF
jgi:esterase